MEKRIMAMLLAVCMIFALLPAPAFAAGEIASGTCGENLTWVLSDDGVLTISGTGPMEDYVSGGAPWYDSSVSITTVIIEDGVTSVGNAAFSGFINLTCGYRL